MLFFILSLPDGISQVIRAVVIGHIAVGIAYGNLSPTSRAEVN